MADTPETTRTLRSIDVTPDEKPVPEGLDLPPGTRYIGSISDVQSGPDALYPMDDGELPPNTKLIGYLNSPPEEKLKEVGIGTAQGATETGSIFGTGYAGARVGAAMAAPLTPIFPAAPIAGAIVGGATGLTAGYLASQEADRMFPEVAREDLAPYREGGKTFGSSIAFAPIAFGLPAANAARVSRFLTVGDTARKYPKSFIAAETLGAAGAGVAGGASEYYYPGEAMPRIGAEIAGGVVAPGRFWVSSYGAIKKGIQNLASSFSESAREKRAADRILAILDEAGEDVPTLVKRLQANLPIAGTPTAAQKTGSKALSILETTLARSNAKYGIETMQQGLDSIAAYEALVKNLQEIGSPKALIAAAELRKTHFDDIINKRLELADQTAADKIGKITNDNAQSRAEIGSIVRSETERALADAREHESMLWTQAEKAAFKTRTVKGQKVVQLKEVTPVVTGQTALEIADSLGPDFYRDAVPAVVRNVMAKMGVTEDAIKRYAAGKRTPEYLETGVVPPEYLVIPPTRKNGKPTSIFTPTTAPELITLRSNLLRMAREASAEGKTANAGFYGKLAESVLDDLSSLKSPEYDAARQFSRSLNDFFTRSYASDVSAVTKKGAEKLPPEILVSKAFGSGSDVAALRMADIESAIGMMKTKYDDAVAQFGARSPQAQELLPYAQASQQGVVSMRDAQSRVLRLAAAKAINPNTGRVNPTTLAKFVAENKVMLDRLGITDDLSDAVKAENALKIAQKDYNFLDTSIRSQTAFAAVLGRESPSAVIADALNSRYPVKNFKAIVRLARSGGPDAVEGLKSSLYDYAFTKANAKGGTFSPAAFDKAFFDPIAAGQPSIFNILRSQNAMSITEAKNLRRLIKPMERVETAIKNNQLSDEVLTGADAVTELALRVTGAKLGTALTPGGNSLVASSAGSKFVRKQFDKMPTVMVRGIIESATKDPKLMALLLQRAQTPTQKYMLGQQIQGYLYAAGLNAAEPDNEPPPQEEGPQYPGTAQKMLRKMPPAPSTRGTPFSRAPAPAAPAPGPVSMATPQGPAGDQSSSRKMLQSLFPMDTISSMA